MGYGRFENRLIASAKADSMEKYGSCSAEDLAAVQEFLSDEVSCEKLDNNKYRLTRAGRSFEIAVKGQAAVLGSTERKGKVEPVEERKDKWVSVFDAKHH